MTIEERIKKVADFQKRYVKEFLHEEMLQKEEYLKSEKSAIFFVLSYSFYQGRLNKVSEMFRDRAFEVIGKFLKSNNILANSDNFIKDKNELIKKYQGLYDLLKKGKVNKENDRLMVLSLINFVQSKKQKNILVHIIGQIKNGKIKGVYNELDSLRSFGQKVTSFVLRDIVVIYELRKHLKKNEFQFVQPIDTWVHRVSKSMEIVKRKNIYTREPIDIVNVCIKYGVDPINYNQGAWYIGANSFKVLMNNVNKL